MNYEPIEPNIGWSWTGAAVIFTFVMSGLGLILQYIRLAAGYL